MYCKKVGSLEEQYINVSTGTALPAAFTTYIDTTHEDFDFRWKYVGGDRWWLANLQAT